MLIRTVTIKFNVPSKNEDEWFAIFDVALQQLERMGLCDCQTQEGVNVGGTIPDTMEFHIYSKFETVEGLRRWVEDNGGTDIEVSEETDCYNV